jgi:hypothetical protein
MQLVPLHRGLDGLWSSAGGSAGGGDGSGDTRIGDAKVAGSNPGGGGDCGGIHVLRVLDLRGTGVTEAAFAACCPSLAAAGAQNDGDGVGRVGTFHHVILQTKQ